MEAIICVGLPASGKSTLYGDSGFFHTYVRINLDMLKTRKREKILFDVCLKAKLNVYIDNTNVTKRERGCYLDELIKNKYDIRCFWFNTEIEECLRRNVDREESHRVNPVAIYSKAKEFEIPEIDEGFNQIISINYGYKQIIVAEGGKPKCR